MDLEENEEKTGGVEIRRAVAGSAAGTCIFVH